MTFPAPRRQRVPGTRRALFPRATFRSRESSRRSNSKSIRQLETIPARLASPSSDRRNRDELPLTGCGSGLCLVDAPLRTRSLIDEPSAEAGDRTGQLVILSQLQCASVHQVLQEHVGIHSPGQAPLRVVRIVGTHCSPDDADNLAFPQSVFRNSSHHRRNQLHRLPHLLAPVGSIAALPVIRCLVLELLDIHLAEVATGLIETPEQGRGLGAEVLRNPPNAPQSLW